jgi:hypothetical protein
VKKLLRDAPSSVGLDILTWHHSQGEVRTTTLTGCILADTASNLGFARWFITTISMSARNTGARSASHAATVVLMSPLRMSLWPLGIGDL